MEKMVIFDPAMCCSTGVCGPGVDPVLLRVSTVLNHLKQNNMEVVRYNLSHEPEAFIHNQTINHLLGQYGVGILPATLMGDKVIKTGGYLSNEEFCHYLGVPQSYLTQVVPKTTVPKRANGCRSEESRVGKECTSWCSCGWSPDHEYKKLHN